MPSRRRSGMNVAEAFRQSCIVGSGYAICAARFGCLDGIRKGHALYKSTFQSGDKIVTVIARVPLSHPVLQQESPEIDMRDFESGMTFSVFNCANKTKHQVHSMAEAETCIL